jgi:hypothetical protein
MELRSSSCQKDKIKSGKLTKNIQTMTTCMKEGKTLEKLWQILSQIITLVELGSMELRSCGCKKDKTKSGRPT